MDDFISKASFQADNGKFKCQINSDQLFHPQPSSDEIL